MKRSVQVLFLFLATFLFAGNPMANIIKIPANTQAYLETIYDAVKGKFDILSYRYNYMNPPTIYGYWKLGEASGNRLDASGSGHDLALTDGDYDPSSSAGKLGDCIVFPANSMNVYELRSPDSLNIDDPQQWTVSFWFKASNIGALSWGNAIVELEFGDGVYFDAYPYDDGTCELYVSLPGTNIDETISLDTTAWHFVCIYYDGNGIYLEVDNALVGSKIGASAIASGSGQVLVTGGNDGSGNMLGYVDELAVWLSALSAASRSQLYNSGAGSSPY